MSSETANYLANVPNYKAYCKLIEGTDLAEYHVATSRCDLPRDSGLRVAVRDNSRELAKPRADVEAFVAKRFASILGRNGQTDGLTYEA